MDRANAHRDASGGGGSRWHSYAAMKTNCLPQLSRAALAAAVLLSSGCASTYRFQVEAIKNSQPVVEAYSFRVECANPDMDPSDLRFQEAAEYVTVALSAKGLYAAPPGTEAAIIVQLDFGLEGPEQEIRSYYVPVETVSSRGAGRPVGGMSNAWIDGARAPGNLFSESSRDDPMLEEEVSFVVTVYDKFLRLSAREAPSAENDHVPHEIWSVLVSNRDESDDLRKYVPLLVTVAMDHVDENLPEPEEIVLSDTDARLAFVERGL